MCSFPLTYDVKPPLPMGLRHDDAHHVSDRLRFHDSKGEEGLIKRDWLSRGLWPGDPLYVKSRCRRVGRGALVCSFNLEIKLNILIVFLKKN